MHGKRWGLLRCHLFVPKFETPNSGIRSLWLDDRLSSAPNSKLGRNHRSLRSDYGSSYQQYATVFHHGQSAIETNSFKFQLREVRYFGCDRDSFTWSGEPVAAVEWNQSDTISRRYCQIATLAALTRIANFMCGVQREHPFTDWSTGRPKFAAYTQHFRYQNWSGFVAGAEQNDQFKNTQIGENESRQQSEKITDNFFSETGIGAFACHRVRGNPIQAYCCDHRQIQVTAIVDVPLLLWLRYRRYIVLAIDRRKKIIWSMFHIECVSAAVGAEGCQTAGSRRKKRCQHKICSVAKNRR